MFGNGTNNLKQNIAQKTGELLSFLGEYLSNYLGLIVLIGIVVALLYTPLGVAGTKTMKKQTISIKNLHKTTTKGR